MIPSLEGWPTKAKVAPSPHEVRLTPLDTNPVFTPTQDLSLITSDLSMASNKLIFSELLKYKYPLKTATRLKLVKKTCLFTRNPLPQLFKYVHIYIYMYVYIYICIYIIPYIPYISHIYMYVYIYVVYVVYKVFRFEI